MGIVTVEELTCDFCGKRISDPSAGLRGRLRVRKLASRGPGRIVEIALHPVCGDRLTAKASKP